MRKCVREDAIEDRLQKLVVIGIEIAIMTMICVSLFSGGPAFKTGAATPSRASVGPKA
jgi:hypothetical protein